MKKLLLCATCIGLTALINTQSFAQQSNSNGKEQDIVIRKKGGQDTKVIIEIKGEDIIVNGQLLSKFKEEGLTIKKLTEHGAHNFMFAHPPGFNFNFSNDGKSDQKALLGVTTTKDVQGAKIIEVSKGSPAEKAGLKQGDIITQVGVKKIGEINDLQSIIQSFKPKDEVQIDYVRNNKPSKTLVKLGSRNEELLHSFQYKDMLDNLKNFESDNLSSHLAERQFNIFRSRSQHLGIRIEDMDDSAGVKILNIEEDSPADKAGLKKDDVITEVDGEAVRDVSSARLALMGGTNKSLYLIKAKRNGVIFSFNVKVPIIKKSMDL